MTAIRQLKVSEVHGVLKQVMAKQGNKCAICGKGFTPKDGPVLDHCHTTGHIRGALHRSCNSIEGRMKALGHRGHAGVSSPDYIIGLGKYLEYHDRPRIALIHPSHMTEDAKRLARNKKAREARARKK